MDTGQILAARAPHARYLPASTLKTLTALTLIPVFDVNKKIMVKPQDVRAEGSRLGIVPGTAYAATALLQGLLMASGNDAAYALARGNQSVAVTLRAMNATAAGLNAADTVAKDPSGLDKPGQTSSAYDLALIGRAAMKLPDFRKYVINKKAVLPIGRSADGIRKPGFTIETHNTLLLNYPGTIGIKSGYTNAAKHTFIGAATRGGKTYIVTQMASPRGSWRPTAALLDWAFANGASTTPIGQLVEPGAAGVAAATATAKPTVAAKAPAESLPATAPDDPARLAALPPWALVAGMLGALALFGGWAQRRRISRRRRRAIVRARSRADLEPTGREPS
jgi:D-alanyl-D-alanine carboxypeptidase (penicillin-binding protein 5/6)